MLNVELDDMEVLWKSVQGIQIKLDIDELELERSLVLNC